MGSWKRFSYRWRLFWPLVIVVWLVIGVLALFQYNHEQQENEKRISNELSFVMSRVLKAWDRNEDPKEFIKFFSDYYDTSPLFINMRVSVYDENKLLRFKTGVPIEIKEFQDAFDASDDDTRDLFSSNDHSTFYTAMYTSDGRYLVMISITSTKRALETFIQEPTMWFLILALGLSATIFVFLYSNYFGRTIRLMNEFADNAASGKPFNAEEKFPHDELGEISRHIVQLYREKDAAREQSERDHQVALHAIDEKMRIKHQLTNNINHELKTPVGVIKGYLDTIAETPDLPKSLHDKFIDGARKNVDRLAGLLQDVSAMARLEDGGGTIPMSEIDFHDLVYSIDNDLENAQLAKKMHFHYSIPLDCLIQGNSNLLTGMLWNLIRNAALHSGGDSMGLILVAESQKFYTFSFYDNGTGVDEVHLSRLFERFYRIDSGRSRKVGGTGLGLPIVKKTVESLGGSISVHNRSNGGLEFIFTLKKWNPDTSGSKQNNPGFDADDPGVDIEPDIE